LGLGEAAACSHQEFCCCLNIVVKLCVAQLGPQELICETWTVTNTLAMHLGVYVIGLPVVCGNLTDPVILIPYRMQAHYKWDSREQLFKGQIPPAEVLQTWLISPIITSIYCTAATLRPTTWLGVIRWQTRSHRMARETALQMCVCPLSPIKYTVIK